MRTLHTASESITLAEVLRAEPMRSVRMHALAGLGRVVDEIRLIDDVEQVRAARPGTLVVLQHGIAQTAWATAITVRYAWERNVRAVICGLDVTAAPSVISLAERLSVPLGIHRGDLPTLALELSAVVAHPEASRARLIARCAQRLARQGEVDAVLHVIEAELPGVHVTLHNPPRDNHEPAGPEPWIRLPMGPMDIPRGRELLATIDRGSVAWARTVRVVLEIARAQIIACEATSRIRLARRRQLERWALRQLTDPERTDSHLAHESTGPWSAPAALEHPASQPRAAAERLGWQIGPRLIAGSILPASLAVQVDDDLDLALAAAWPETGDLTGPVRHGAGWGVWLSFENDHPDGEPGPALDRQATRSLLALLRRCLDEVAVGVPLVAGIGTPVDHDGLTASLRRAELAARAAQDEPDARVLPFTEVGPRAFLAAAASPALREAAGDMLAPLVDVEDGAVLARTLAAYLDCGGSTGRAAELLGVHRNTVSGRLDRIRRVGLDLDDPGTRLGIHMAAHLLGH
ncbi:helix-turn-helix domain-containing protein [Intrasporangium sp.]|uniref:helix-turn-helix domain-containing protein n=1 Tax=Intrasporangium sp. TaxID=1925024 RepID=UPI003221CE12